MRMFSLVLTILFVGACTGDAGPTGPSGPPEAQGPTGLQGPQGPAGPGIGYTVGDGIITNTTMSTDFVNTNGVTPGIVCYATNVSTPGVWITWDTDPSDGTACGIVQNGASFAGRAIFPASMVNSGWSVRIILFWASG